MSNPLVCGRDMAEASEGAPSARREAEPVLPASVDVVILSWERVECTLAAMESALAQKGVRVSVIIVDQGSSSATLERLRAAAAHRRSVRLHELDRNVGIPGGRNIGIALGSAEFVVGLDNDAVFDSTNALATAVERFRAEPATAAIGFRVINAFTRELDVLSWGYPRAQLDMADQSFTTTRFVGGAHACRRAAFEAAGGYDPTLVMCWEEVDLCYRLLNLGYNIAYEPSVVISHMISPMQRTNWANGRYYYFVRNRLFIEYKYGSLVKTGLRATGYIFKGIFNGLYSQAARGCVDAGSMCWRLRRSQRVRLSPSAQAYIEAYERQARGRAWYRLRAEVLAKLP